MAKKVKLKINTYTVIQTAIEAGIEYGYNRAHKHTDNPDPDLIKQQILDACMNELCEVVLFPDPYTEPK